MLLRKDLFPYRSSGVNFKKAVEGLCILERHKHVTLRSKGIVSFSSSFQACKQWRFQRI